MDKIITVKEFVDGYKKQTDDVTNKKEKYIKKFVGNNYVNYATKLSVADQIVQLSSTNQVDGQVNGQIKINSSLRYLLYVFNLIDLYTNITVDFSNILEEYDLLEEQGLVDELIRLMPQREVTSFETILKMVFYDFIQNNYENHAFISNQVQRIVDIFTATTSPLIEKIKEKVENMTEEDIDKLGNKVEKILKKISR